MAGCVFPMGPESFQRFTPDSLAAIEQRISQEEARRKKQYQEVHTHTHTHSISITSSGMQTQILGIGMITCVCVCVRTWVMWSSLSPAMTWRQESSCRGSSLTSRLTWWASPWRTSTLSTSGTRGCVAPSVCVFVRDSQLPVRGTQGGKVSIATVRALPPVTSSLRDGGLSPSEPGGPVG